ncbi:MAG: NAD(P)/FAD-dependent oxidoreductase [Candidatus Liptonbacteria bacterium]|nr:NAD(P)/FAD-dependent oxidoreductase [Candidatus Liptonbacteria bacterium]
MSGKKNVVVLGAGFGGLRAAELLAKKLRKARLTDRYEVILVDRSEYQTYTPLLYEIATTSKETANACELLSVATYPIRSLVKSLPVTFLAKEIKEIDAEKGVIRFGDIDELPFEHLLLALGAETNYFDIPGLKDHALPLKTFIDAMKIRDKVWMLAMEGQKIIRIIVGGAGPSGVEIAGEFKAWCGELEKELQACSLEVILVEGAPTVLPGFDARVVDQTTIRLKNLGVEILTNEKITSVDKETVVLGSGRNLPYDVCLWTGGVKGSSLLRELPLELDPRGRPLVNDTMECKALTNSILHSKIYGIGDAVCFIDPRTQKPIPGIARAAIDQGTVAANNIFEEIQQKESGIRNHELCKYVPGDFPYVVPIGGKFALAKIGPVIIRGFFGWVLKGLVELNYLLSIMSLFRALKIWFKGLKIFIQNDRLG